MNKPNHADKKLGNRSNADKRTKKHIMIDTPCSVSDMEKFLCIVSSEGHWHDATIRGEDGKVVIEFEDF